MSLRMNEREWCIFGLFVIALLGPPTAFTIGVEFGMQVGTEVGMRKARQAQERLASPAASGTIEPSPVQ